MKSEPDAFSIDDLNASAPNPGTACATTRRATSCAMACGRRRGLFYHSNCKVPGIAGIARVASAAYPDETQFDPTSEYFDPRARANNRAGCWSTWPSNASSSALIPLEEIKQHTDQLGEGFALTAKGNRLSVFPGTAAQWKLLLSLE
jgi:predicted RNA-binding protein with PUA-like domain